jgi:hypothetical protein
VVSTISHHSHQFWVCVLPGVPRTIAQISGCTIYSQPYSQRTIHSDSVWFTEFPPSSYRYCSSLGDDFVDDAGYLATCAVGRVRADTVFALGVFRNRLAANGNVSQLVVMWRWRKTTRRRKRPTSVTKHYLAHKEQARSLVLARLEYFNQHYQLEWNRVAIRNQRRCWGSCSSKKNLNFKYKIHFLPTHLQDYIIVHELCHLVHLNHGTDFWALVCERLPAAKEHVSELRQVERNYQKTGDSGLLQPVS